MLGYTPDSIAFALTTGFGDAVGVMLGHCAFYAAKKSITNDTSINMNRETQTGLLLASAAFCSGTAWQPLVDMLQAAELPFFQVFAGTWVGCDTRFIKNVCSCSGGICSATSMQTTQSYNCCADGGPPKSWIFVRSACFMNPSDISSTLAAPSYPSIDNTLPLSRK